MMEGLRGIASYYGEEIARKRKGLPFPETILQHTKGLTISIID